MVGGRRMLQNEEIQNLCSSPSKIRTIELKRMRWTGHIARIVKRGMHIEFFWKAKRKNTAMKIYKWGGTIILKWILET
jgi:hypothetical protein